MADWQWSVAGIEDRYGQSKGYSATGVVEAECGEHALHQLLAEIPGPWDELDSDEEFTVTISPA